VFERPLSSDRQAVFGYSFSQKYAFLWFQPYFCRMYKIFLRPLLFRLSAETAHHFTFGLVRWLFRLPLVPFIFRKIYQVEHPTLVREVFGLRFENPVGLAAGFDKNALLVDELAEMGFGFLEIGTVTPQPQPGNELPRLFRLLPDEAIINRMGFNNEGMAAVCTRLRQRQKRILIGGNIGKNKITPNEQALSDYLECFEALYDLVDYFVVNVSSPNTPDLRALQEKEPLMHLLGTLQQANAQKPQAKPILLKIAPDLSNSQLDDILEIVEKTQTAGIIATNTTIQREGLHTSAEALATIGAGGLSGRPLRQRATEVIRYLSERSGGQLPIIGVGGIHSAADALEKIAAGATLIQLYTGFIYEGPALVKQINKALVQSGR
jgi:dihydroorotate dehydrogenase